MYGNRLTGTIPSCLGSQAPSLISLQVQDNRLTGSLPSLWSSPALKSFVASNNARLGGTLPSSLFTHCPSLVALVMEGTMLSGRLPASLGGGENFSASLLNLETIALAGNRVCHYFCTVSLSPFFPLTFYWTLFLHDSSRVLFLATSPTWGVSPRFKLLSTDSLGHCECPAVTPPPCPPTCNC